MVGADLVLVCVPIECTLDVIRNAARYLDPTTALADITSIKTPIATYSRLAHLVAQKDQAALRCEFEAAHSVFRKEADRALKESDHVIDSLNTLLAAREVEQQFEAKIYAPYVGPEKCTVLKKLSLLERLPMN